LRDVDVRRPGVAEGLVGRGRELDLLRSFLERAAVDGEAFLLSGEPGVGKTVLLDAAADAASTAGSRLLRAAGVEFEVDVGFSGLNQLLFPLYEQLEQLGSVHRNALSVALGFGDGAAASRLTVSTAALKLLRLAAATHPLLVIVDDLQWLDRSSAAVLAFVARRLTGSRVGLITAWRAGTESFFERGGLPVYDLRPLDEDAATGLLNARFPTLAANVRHRVLAEAQGNPLALLELPAVLDGPQRTARQALPAVLPLNRRLRALFASRVADLPAITRRLLLLAVLDGTGDLAVLQAATGDNGLEALQPAEQARLAAVDPSTGRLAFRHPLVRSTVVDRSTDSERRQARRALADALVEQPERRAWHLANATVGPDEKVAHLLEHAAQRLLRRGDAVGAVAALLRAADHSPHGTDRSRLLAEAAYVGADVTGALRTVPQLLADAHRADPDLSGSLEAAVATAYQLLNGEGDVDTALRLLVGAIEARLCGLHADDHALTEALHTLLTVCWFGGGGAEVWKPFHAAVARLTPPAPVVLSLCAAIFADPARTTAASLDQLDTTISHLHEEADPARIVRIGMAAFFVDRMAGCRSAHWRVVRDGREGGAVASAIGALIHLCLDDLLVGLWDEAWQLADEGLELCQAHGYQLLRWPLWFGQAFLAAGRGDDDTVRMLTDGMVQWAAPRAARTVQLYASHARAFAALGRGDVEDAYHHAAAVSPPGILASHVPLALWTAMDLVEAAVRTGRHAEATAHVTALRDADIAAMSPRLALLACGSAAIAAPAASATGLFEEALAIPGVERWPFDLARVRLIYGERLRRAHATAEAQVQLTAALETFQRLEARPWATRARSELRATGHNASFANELGSASLTPQEHEIAMLAAIGLTNKQIGQRLFLSHRTVAAHLYRVFPKLGITSRAALRDALSPPQRGDHHHSGPPEVDR
jgi:DNA-binding CsgD family transcriptional regulator